MADVNALEVLQSVNPILLEIEEGDIVTDVVVLVRVARFEDEKGFDAIVIGVTDNTGGITQYGLVMAGKLQLEDWMQHGDDGD